MKNPFETKIKAWAKEDESIARALEIATRAHQGQLDKAGVPYINHPIAVAVALGADEPRDTEAVVAALLHDVLEDTAITQQELASTFSPEIIDAILSLTRQANEDYESFIHRLATNRLARKVQIADLRHNLKPERLKKLSNADQKRLRKKYTNALNYLITFVDKDELAKQLLEEASSLPPGTLPHDAMNKAMFVHPEMLESLLRFYVDEPFIQDLDLKHIEPLPNEFITETMRKRYSDCIRKVRWKGRDAYLLVILEFQSTKDIWIPVRILAYMALLWLDRINNKLLSIGIPADLNSGTIPYRFMTYFPLLQRLCSSTNQTILSCSEKIIKDEVLNKNSDFYALYLELKRAKTPIAMQEAINKYKDVLALPKHQELLKAIIAIVETLYKRFSQDAGASNIRFASLEEAVKMIDSTGIDWKKNMQEKFYIEWKNEGKREDALAMLHKGFSPEIIGEITDLPQEEIEKLQTQSV